MGIVQTMLEQSHGPACFCLEFLVSNRQLPERRDPPIAKMMGMSGVSSVCRTARRRHSAARTAIAFKTTVALSGMRASDFRALKTSRSLAGWHSRGVVLHAMRRSTKISDHRSTYRRGALLRVCCLQIRLQLGAAEPVLLISGLVALTFIDIDNTQLLPDSITFWYGGLIFNLSANYRSALSSQWQSLDICHSGSSIGDSNGDRQR